MFRLFRNVVVFYPFPAEKSTQNFAASRLQDAPRHFGPMIERPVIEEPPSGYDGSPLRVGGTEGDPADPGMNNGPHAHYAGLQRDVEGGLRQAIVPQDLGGGADGQDLCMGGRILETQRPVVRPADGFFPDCHYGADGDLTLHFRQKGLFQGQGHEELVVVHFPCLPDVPSNVSPPGKGSPQDPVQLGNAVPQVRLLPPVRRLQDRPGFPEARHRRFQLGHQHLPVHLRHGRLR